MRFTKLMVLMVTLLAVSSSTACATLLEEVEKTLYGNKEVTPKDANAPPKPVDIVLTPDETSIGATWTSGGGTTDSYFIRWCVGRNCTNFGAGTAVAGTSTSISGLTAATAYRVAVSALNASATASNAAYKVTKTTGGGGGDSGGGASTTCTDGTDCRCDVLVATYGNDIVFCEDFENPILQADGGWQGGGGGWSDQNYTGINAWCQGQTGIAQNGQGITNMVNNNGCIYLLERGDASTQPGSGPSETKIPLADQTFDGNITLMQTIRPLDGTQVVANDGNTYALRQPGGLHGDAEFDRAVTSFGITTARYLPVDLLEQGSAWKGNQYTPAKAALLGTFNTMNTTVCGGANTGFNTDYLPYAGTLWDAVTDTESFTNTVGTSCKVGTGTASRLKSRPALVSAGQPLFPKGQWVCQQVQYENWGSTNGRIRHWVDGNLVIDVDVDMSNPSTTPNWVDPEGTGLFRFTWNNYYNGVPPGGGSNFQGVVSTRNQGPDTTVWSGRLQDNLVVKEGAPVSCADIGFSS